LVSIGNEPIVDEYIGNDEKGESQLDDHKADPRGPSGRSPRVLASVVNHALSELAKHLRPQLANHRVVECFAAEPGGAVVGSQPFGPFKCVSLLGRQAAATVIRA